MEENREPIITESQTKVTPKPDEKPDESKPWDWSKQEIEDFTPLPKFEESTITKVPEFKEPTETTDINELQHQLQQIVAAGQAKPVTQENQQTQQPKKNFLTVIFDAIKNFFRKLFHFK